MVLKVKSSIKSGLLLKSEEFIRSQKSVSRPQRLKRFAKDPRAATLIVLRSEGQDAKNGH